jgi:hypothetical protein
VAALQAGHRGGMKHRAKRAESRATRNKDRKARDAARAEYLKQMRERAEWAVALVKYCEAAGHPIVFRKADLIALRRP